MSIYSKLLLSSVYSLLLSHTTCEKVPDKLFFLNPDQKFTIDIPQGKFSRAKWQQNLNTLPRVCADSRAHLLMQDLALVLGSAANLS